ncbi:MULTISPECIES: hypothetical protein [Streptomyces]|uniref:Uncharacterized protein n=1 Tax=Streptomyces scabiei (strain 87.22) TaxID=680198 RepID=C9Z2B2_STRSW|nr:MULTISPECIES: hypothetical protein [Streptomyces]MBP5907449.1 hypothetical protein [Streptomyces sp. LBUM 1478]MBP5929667.1 hypothetical protein [Streptomyces sp. LBUM 1479]KFG09219.1 hypothetical protein IQ61_09515 [Streptomyces scabiei]MBP5891912.1 hypothetical protein [Streptomyces sp. LBUM 1481]MBP5922069.1 hypothetical protein [Streptomyces sp. LBUM 1483]
MAGLEPYRDELLSAVTDDGTGNWLNLLAANGFRIQPHSKGVEFEIKYAPQRSGTHGELGDCARSLLAPDGLPDGVISPPWLVFRATTVEYWLLGSTELSKQRKSDGTDALRRSADQTFRDSASGTALVQGYRSKGVKRKVHQIFRDPATGTPLVQATEDFLTDPDRITAAFAGCDGSAGVVYKTRAKGHYVHLADGIVFNLVESRCRIGDAEQIQLELEYGAHIHHESREPTTECTEAELRTRLWNLHHLLTPRIDEANLATTAELKRDFVQAARDKHT